MKRRKKGFTLAESVVAIAIITVISTVAIGTYYSARSSTNRQWGKYMSTVMADNMLACFQGAEDLDEFEVRKLSQLQQCGDRIGDDYDVDNSVAFKTIRAYETGKVKVYNQSLDINNDLYTGHIADFEYSDLNNYKNDVHDRENSLDKSGIFSSKKKVSSTVTGLTLKQDESKFKISNEDKSSGVSTNYYVDANGKTKLKMTYEFYDTVYEYKDVKYESDFELTELEKYLYSKLQILGFVDNCPNVTSQYAERIYDADNTVNGNDYLYFYVYNITEDGLKHATDSSGKYLALRIVFSKGELGSAEGNKWDLKKELTVKKVQYAYISRTGNTYTDQKIQDGSYKDYADDKGNKFENFSWGGLPLFAYYCSQQISWRITPHYDDKNFTVERNTEDVTIYTDYTVKSGSSADVSRISYALLKPGDSRIYSKADTLLFEYTGESAENTLVNGLGFSQDSSYGTDASGFNKYRVIGEAPGGSYGTQDYYYLPGGSAFGSYFRVTYSNTVSGERRIVAWVLPKSDIDKLLDGKTSKAAKDEILSKESYLSYRKG